MSAAPQYILSGPEATRAIEKARQAQLNREYWPYIHEFAPPDSIPVHEVSQSPLTAIPAPGSTGVALVYKVPSGFRFYMHSILETFASGSAFLPGDLVWSVTMDTPIAPAIADLQGQRLQGLESVPFPLGSITAGTQWPFARAYEIEPLSILRSIALNQTFGGSGVLISGFFGYLVPAGKSKK